MLPDLGRHSQSPRLSVEVLTWFELLRHFVFVVIKLKTRRVEIAGTGRQPTVSGASGSESRPIRGQVRPCAENGLVEYSNTTIPERREASPE